MGAWGLGAFDDDTASDWTHGLAETTDLSFVRETLYSAEDADDDELDAELASVALAACEVVARLQGRANRGSSGDLIDRWIKSHAVKPTPALVQLATSVLDRLAVHQAWAASVQDLRKRVAG